MGLHDRPGTPRPSIDRPGCSAGRDHAVGSPTSPTGTPVSHGWVTYAAVLVTVGAVGNVLWGLAALKGADTWARACARRLGPRGSLGLWGWVAVVWSVVLVVGAAVLFAGHRSGHVVGVSVASLSSMFWLVAILAFPLFALTGSGWRFVHLRPARDWPEELA